MPASRVTEHGQYERFEGPGHPVALAVGIVALLTLFALGALGLGNSLAPEDTHDVTVVVLPRSTGRPAVEVQRQLEQMGLFVEIRYASNETAPADTVTGQEPIAGSRIEVGKLVVVTVSDGPAGVQVPDAAGLQRIAATNLLQVVGLGADVEDVFDDLVRPGEVVSTRPDAGSRAQPGSTVVLRMSKGPRPRVVPDLVGQSEARAFNLIANAELQIGRVERRSSSEVAPGSIISSSPAAGEEVPRFTPIRLVISRVPQMVSVPDLVLMTRASASRIVSNLGLHLDTTTIPVPPGDTRGGIIVSQSPIAGTTVDEGATVTVTVGVAPSPPPRPEGPPPTTGD